MIFQFLLQYITGYLSVEIIGKNTRRLINLCASNNIKLQHVKYIDEAKYSCVIKSNDIFKIIPLFRKTKTRFIIISKNGTTRYVNQFRKRVYCVILFILMVIMVRDFSGRMWRINTVGNSKITTQQIINVLDDKGYKKGQKIDFINCKEIDSLLREEFQDLIWVSSSFNGTTLTVLTKERIISDEKEEQSYGDIIASKDAIIASIITRSGKPLCHKGDKVNKGDVLVSTQVPIQDEYENDMGVLAAKADAEITGYVVYDYSKSYNVRESILVETGKERKSLKVSFGENEIKIPMYLGEYENKTETTQYYSVNPFDLMDNPILIGVSTKKELKYSEKINTDEELKQLCNEDFNKFIDELEKNGVLILSKNVIMDKVGDYVQTTGKIYGCEDIVKYSQER